MLENWFENLRLNTVHRKICLDRWALRPRSSWCDHSDLTNGSWLFGVGTSCALCKASRRPDVVHRQQVRSMFRRRTEERVKLGFRKFTTYT